MQPPYLLHPRQCSALSRRTLSGAQQRPHRESGRFLHETCEMRGSILPTALDLVLCPTCGTEYTCVTVSQG